MNECNACKLLGDNFVFCPVGCTQIDGSLPENRQGSLVSNTHCTQKGWFAFCRVFFFYTSSTATATAATLQFTYMIPRFALLLEYSQGSLRTVQHTPVKSTEFQRTPLHNVLCAHHDRSWEPMGAIAFWDRTIRISFMDTVEMTSFAARGARIRLVDFSSVLSKYGMTSKRFSSFFFLLTCSFISSAMESSWHNLIIFYFKSRFWVAMVMTLSMATLAWIACMAKWVTTLSMVEKVSQRKKVIRLTCVLVLKGEKHTIDSVRVRVCAPKLGFSTGKDIIYGGGDEESENKLCGNSKKDKIYCPSEWDTICKSSIKKDVIFGPCVASPSPPPPPPNDCMDNIQVPRSYDEGQNSIYFEWSASLMSLSSPLYWLALRKCAAPHWIRCVVLMQAIFFSVKSLRCSAIFFECDSDLSSCPLICYWCWYSRLYFVQKFLDWCPQGCNVINAASTQGGIITGTSGCDCIIGSAFIDTIYGFGKVIPWFPTLPTHIYMVIMHQNNLARILRTQLLDYIL